MKLESLVRATGEISLESVLIRLRITITLGILYGLLVLGPMGCSLKVITCRQLQSQLAHSSNKAIIPVASEVEGWKDRHTALKERIKRGNAGLLFIGDSITQGWENFPELWNGYFSRWDPVNEGFRGDRTEHVLWRLSNGGIDGIRPKIAVLLIGTNNSGSDEYSAEQIAEGIEAIICTLRTKLPDTKVLLLAIFPRGSVEQRNDQTQNATYNPQWAKNDRASQLASRMADHKMIFYLDINKRFLNGQGLLSREIMPDLLHLKEKGYRILGETIRPVIEGLLSSK